MNENLIKLINYIINFQKENDPNWTPLPVDEHSNLIFVQDNFKCSFEFSNSIIRDNCRLSIPLSLLKDYSYFVDQEDGFTYYKIKQGETSRI